MFIVCLFFYAITMKPEKKFENKFADKVELAKQIYDFIERNIIQDTNSDDFLLNNWLENDPLDIFIDSLDDKYWLEDIIIFLDMIKYDRNKMLYWIRSWRRYNYDYDKYHYNKYCDGRYTNNDKLCNHLFDISYDLTTYVYLLIAVETLFLIVVDNGLTKHKYYENEDKWLVDFVLDNKLFSAQNYTLINIMKEVLEYNELEDFKQDILDVINVKRYKDIVDKLEIPNTYRFANNVLNTLNNPITKLFISCIFDKMGIKHSYSNRNLKNELIEKIKQDENYMKVFDMLI